jgi:hypothetical protein
MDITEGTIIDSEVALIRKKILKSKVFLIVFFIFLSLWIWIWNIQEPSFFINFISIILGLSLITTTYFSSAKFIRTRKDFNYRIKIIEHSKVLDKYTTTNSNSRITNYYIILDSKAISKYDVAEDMYMNITTGDFICLEYSKYANWILKIKHNGINIENKNIIA